MKMKKMKNRILSIVLSACIMVSQVSITATATEDGIFDHHAVYTTECGYTESVSGQDCQYQCAECMQLKDSLFERTLEGTQEQENLTEITDVYVTIEMPLLWSKNTELKVSVDENQPYVVTQDEYERHWRDGGGSEIDSFNNAIFVAGFNIIPKAGYQLTSQTKVWVNGSEASMVLVGEGTNLNGDVTYRTYPAIKETIGEVSLEIPEPKKGDVVTDYSFQDSANRFGLTGSWYRFDRDAAQFEAMTVGTDTFAEGEIYELQLSLELSEGYLIARNTNIYINGKERLWWESENWQKESLCFDLGLDTQEQQLVHISSDAIPTVHIGDHFSAESVQIPAEETNIAVSGYWVYEDETGAQIREGSFEDGKVYYFVLDITPKAGFTLTDDLILLIGEEEGFTFKSSGIYRAQYKLRTSFLPVITEAELLNLPQANLGDTLQCGWFTVEVPEGALYKAEGIWMYQVGESNFTDVREADGSNIVQLGNNYDLQVFIKPIAGYDISDNVQVKVDGVIHTLDSKDVWDDFVRFSQTFEFKETKDEEDTPVEDTPVEDAPVEDMSVEDTPAKEPENTNPSQEPPTEEEIAEIILKDIEEKNKAEENMPVTSFVSATAVKTIPIEVKEAASEAVYNVSKITTTHGFVAAVDKIVKANIKEKTVALYSDKPFTFNAASLAALTNTKKEFVYMFKHEGRLYKVTIPAGAKVDLEGQRFAGPLYIGAKLRTTEVVK